MDNRIIAEIGSVHDGSFGNAKKLIEAAAQAKATTVKFQLHLADAETLTTAPSPDYFSDETRSDYFKRTSFTRDQWLALKRHADQNNIGFLASPFSCEAVDILEDIGVEEYKIPSGENTNLPLLNYIAKTNKPVYLSSGMSNWAELDVAVERFNKDQLTVMQCSSKYPCPPSHVGLNLILEIKDRYGCAVGFSDHTLGSTAAIAAATLGATIIEKHFTFSKLMYGSDAQHSMEPGEFSDFTQSLRKAWEMLSHPVNKDDLSEYLEMKKIFEKSIVSATDLTKGTIISLQHLAFKKPGTGISASQYEILLGKRLMNNVNSNHLFSIEDFE